MKKDILIMELVDNSINLYYKNIYSINTINKNALDVGRINDSELFQKELSKCLKKSIVCKTIINPMIIIIVCKTFIKSFQFLLKSILNDLGFYKIKYIYNFELISKNTMIINNTNFIYKNIYFEFNRILTIELIIKLLKPFLNEDLLLIGNHDNISKIHILLLKEHSESFLIDESKKYLIKQIIKKNHNFNL